MSMPSAEKLLEFARSQLRSRNLLSLDLPRVSESRVRLNVCRVDLRDNSLEDMAKWGEANNRKAKLIFFYEWELVLLWQAVWDDPETGGEIKGQITIPNLSEEHTDLRDVDIEINVTSSGQADLSRKVKEFLRKEDGARQLREVLQKYVDALKSEFSQGLILPKGGGAAPAAPKPTVRPTPVKAAPSGAPAQALGNLDLGPTLETITMELEFKCTGQEIFNALTQPEMLRVFTGSEVVMASAAQKGQKFELLGGNIQGEFLEVKPFTRIGQKWRLKSWPAGHYSAVTMVISQGSEATKLSLTQTAVPSTEVENTRQGWDRYYWDAIKRTFGFGSLLF
eukprot:snap_masked-scaffold912_size81766-processed-gene-0.11 protein:Tk07078 transcript:snap_masked-scaffold912_size81766-processed-gene-0.11-mRNA-1 annotation:"activator of 90 kda heat shock protein atpase homolog 1"